MSAALQAHLREVAFETWKEVADEACFNRFGAGLDDQPILLPEALLRRFFDTGLDAEEFVRLVGRPPVR